MGPVADVAGAMTPRRYGLLLAGILLLALAVRVGVTSRFQGLAAPPNVPAFPDQREYEAVAYHLATGHGYSLHPPEPTAARPPGRTTS